MPALNMVCSPSGTPLEKTNFSFASGSQLEIAPGLGISVSISLSCRTSSDAHPAERMLMGKNCLVLYGAIAI